jgi:hypothetical protein
MIIRRIINLGLILLIILLAFSNVSCRSRKVECHSNGQYKSQKLKKNKSKYNALYGQKSRPVKKSYVIKNKSR